MSSQKNIMKRGIYNYIKNGSDLDSNSDESVFLAKLIGSNIKHMRTIRKLTQAELAELVDLPVQTISNIESGLRIPKYDKVFEISRALGTNPLWIYGDLLDKNACIQLMFSYFFEYAKDIDIDDDGLVSVKLPKEFAGIIPVFKEYQDRCSRIKDLDPTIKEYKKNSPSDSSLYNPDSDPAKKQIDMHIFNCQKRDYWLDSWPAYDTDYCFENGIELDGITPSNANLIFDSDFIQYCKEHGYPIAP